MSLDIRVAHEVPWARPHVFLVSGAQDLEYCGQNLTDASTSDVAQYRVPYLAYPFSNPGTSYAFEDAPPRR